MSINRRRFVQWSMAGSALASSKLSYDKIAGANQQLRFAVVGFGGRGKALINCVKKLDNAVLVALCDADKSILEKHDSNNHSLFRTTNVSELLNRNDIDAVASATPNHWHTLISIMSCKAGKHVYIEKPISHNMSESRSVVAASDKTGKLIQCGFQNRSDSGLTTFYRNLHDGKYGTVLSVHGTCHRARKSIGKLEKPLSVPSQIDYQQWLGPAVEQPIMRPRLHYDWHWDFNTGNGDVGNQGPHEWDLINWALGDPNDLPTEMQVAGNRFGWKDAGNTPNVMGCVGKMNGIPIRFEVMDLKPGSGAPFGRGVGVIIETEKGRFVGGRGGGYFEHKDGKKEIFKRNQDQKSDGTLAHMQNFVECVVSDNRTGLKSDCRVAANSASMAHMANISFRLAERSEDSKLSEAFASSETTSNMLKRLRVSTIIYANKHKIQEMEPWLLGPKLNFDNRQQTFVGSQADAANQLMNREYRSSFELPKI